MKPLAIRILAASFLVTMFFPPIWAQAATTHGKDSSRSAPAISEKGAKTDGKLDLNTASAADLKRAGFTETEARKIVRDRPYKSKDELVRKNIVSKEKYDQVKDRVIAHQKTAEARQK